MPKHASAKEISERLRAIRGNLPAREFLWKIRQAYGSAPSEKTVTNYETTKESRSIKPRSMDVFYLLSVCETFGISLETLIGTEPSAALRAIPRDEERAALCSLIDQIPQTKLDVVKGVLEALAEKPVAPGNTVAAPSARSKGAA